MRVYAGVAAGSRPNKTIEQMAADLAGLLDPDNKKGKEGSKKGGKKGSKKGTLFITSTFKSSDPRLRFYRFRCSGAYRPTLPKAGRADP